MSTDAAEDIQPSAGTVASALEVLPISLDIDLPPHGNVQARKRGFFGYLGFDILSATAALIALAAFALDFYAVFHSNDGLSKAIDWLVVFSLFVLALLLGYATVALHQSNRKVMELHGRLSAFQDWAHQVNEARRKISNDLARDHKERETVAADLKTELKRRDAMVSNAFHLLSQKRSDFELLVTEFFLLLADPKTRAASLKTDRLRHELKELMVTICDTAVDVIATRKDNPKKCCANIKWFVTRSDTKAGYVVLAQSHYYDSDRKEREDELQKRPPLIDSNLIYHDLFEDLDGKQEKRFSVRHVHDDFVIGSDVREVLSAIHGNRSAEGFKFPLDDATNFYHSYLAVPVHGAAAHGALARGEHISIPFRDGRAFGVFCIDSVELGYFNREYDMKTMKELAVAIFDCMRSFHAVKTAIGQLSQN